MTIRTINKTLVECDYCHENITDSDDIYRVTIQPPPKKERHHITLFPVEMYDYHTLCFKSWIEPEMKRVNA